MIPEWMLDNYGMVKDRYLFPLFVVGVLGAAVALTLVIAYAVVFPLERRACNINANNLGTEAKHVNWIDGNGCFLRDGDKWVPQNQYRKVIG